MKLITFKQATLAFAVAATFFTSCKRDEIVPVQNARLQVIHASPDAPGVDLLIDNVKQNTSALTFPNNTAYINVTPGSRTVRINPTGTATSVINSLISFSTNKSYSLFAVDSVSKISALLIEDDLTAPATGKAHVRFVHLSPNAPAVDIAVAGSNSKVFSNVAFKGYTPFSSLAAGTYNLDVRPAGDTTVVLALPPLTIQAGKIYTVFAKGFLGATGAQALDARVYANN